MKFFQKNFVFLHINKLTQRMLTPNTDTLFRFSSSGLWMKGWCGLLYALFS